MPGENGAGWARRLAAIAALTMIVGSVLSVAQTDIKRLIAYTSISHMGFVVLALYAGTLLSFQGLMIQMLAHGLSSAALFIMSGQLYERLHTRDLSMMGGMWGQMRYYPPLLMFFSAALLGIPGTGNFIGEFLILLGSFADHPVAVVFATFSLVLAGLYALIMIYKALFGEATPTVQKIAPMRDINVREASILLVLAFGLLWLGLYPQSFLDTSDHSMQWINQAYHMKSVAPVTQEPFAYMEVK